MQPCTRDISLVTSSFASLPVVDHFFKPETLVQNPYDDETVGVTSGQLVVLLIPGCYYNAVCMALQTLICIQTLTS